MYWDGERWGEFRIPLPPGWVNDGGSTGQGSSSVLGAGGRGVKVVAVTWSWFVECQLSGGKHLTGDTRVLETRIRSCLSIQVQLFVNPVTRDIS